MSTIGRTSKRSNHRRGLSKSKENRLVNEHIVPPFFFLSRPPYIPVTGSHRIPYVIIENDEKINLNDNRDKVAVARVECSSVFFFWSRRFCPQALFLPMISFFFLLGVLKKG